jgi:outer membrane protein OmpA-like peptidoglycan-associated protein
MTAVSMGIAYLNNTASDRDKYLVIIDNLLPVDGEFMFDDNNVHAYFAGERSLIDSRMDITVQHLLENNIIADLSGVTVIVAGGGNTSLPQKPLSSNQRTLLWMFWEKVFNAANAEEIIRIPGQTGVKSNSVLPVRTITFPTEEGIVFAQDAVSENAGEESSAPADETDDLYEPVFIGEWDVSFVPDTNIYLDERAAISVLTPIAEKLLDERNTGISMLLIGCTAGDRNSSYTLELSLARANAVKSTLESLGVPSNRLQAIGSGNDNKWHIPGLKLSDPLSQMNRQVVLLRADSDTALEILAKHELP